jgi:nucleotide-binding universal stress UspA family protein
MTSIAHPAGLPSRPATGPIAPARIHRILCATDLSPASRAAWSEAQLLGRLLGAEVVLLHVVAPPTLPAEGYLPPAVYQQVVDGGRQSAVEELARLVESVTGPKPNVQPRIEDGPAAPTILEIAAREAVDLLVVGTHGRTGLPRIVLGSVADRLVRQATCPVLIARSAPDASPRGRIARICFAADFSPSAEAAWRWVVTLATAAGAEVDLVHVLFEPVAAPHMPPEAVEQMAQLLRDQGLAAAEGFLERSSLPRERVHVVLPTGAPGTQIVRRAQERQADLIVLGTHGWSGLVRWMLGSVAHHVIQTAPCPVLTVGPAARAEAPAPA